MSNMSQEHAWSAWTQHRQIHDDHKLDKNLVEQYAIFGSHRDVQAMARELVMLRQQLSQRQDHERQDHGRDQRQAVVLDWAKRAFTVEQATSLPQRSLRLLEEATELFQAVGGDADKAHDLVNFVFGCEAGDVQQELGGVGVCVLALAGAAGLSADLAEQAEVDRVLSKPIEHFTQRNAAKNAAGLLMKPPPELPKHVEDKIRAHFAGTLVEDALRMLHTLVQMKPGQGRYLSIGLLRQICSDVPPDAVPLIADFLVDADFLIKHHEVWTDENDDMEPIEEEDLEEAQRTGRLYNPRTGNPINYWQEKLSAYYAIREDKPTSA